MNFSLLNRWTMSFLALGFSVVYFTGCQRAAEQKPTKMRMAGSSQSRSTEKKSSGLSGKKETANISLCENVQKTSSAVTEDLRSIKRIAEFSHQVFQWGWYVSHLHANADKKSQEEIIKLADQIPAEDRKSSIFSLIKNVSQRFLDLKSSSTQTSNNCRSGELDLAIKEIIVSNDQSVISKYDLQVYGENPIDQKSKPAADILLTIQKLEDGWQIKGKPSEKIKAYVGEAPALLKDLQFSCKLTVEKDDVVKKVDCVDLSQGVTKVGFIRLNVLRYEREGAVEFEAHSHEYASWEDYFAHSRDKNAKVQFPVKRSDIVILKGQMPKAVVTFEGEPVKKENQNPVPVAPVTPPPMVGGDDSVVDPSSVPSSVPSKESPSYSQPEEGAYDPTTTVVPTGNRDSNRDSNQVQAPASAEVPAETLSEPLSESQPQAQAPVPAPAPTDDQTAPQVKDSSDPGFDSIQSR